MTLEQAETLTSIGIQPTPAIRPESAFGRSGRWQDFPSGGRTPISWARLWSLEQGGELEAGPRGGVAAWITAEVLLFRTDPRQARFRTVRVDDAAGMWRLVRHCGVLDLNSPYAYLLLCRHHHRTCLVAEEAGSLVGFVTAYVPPTDPEVVFVWQVGVADSHRRHGVGRALIDELLDRCPEARFLECTVAPSNDASLALFRAVAAARRVPIEVRPGFAAEHFPAEASAHEREDVVRVGPLTPAPSGPTSLERRAPA